MSRFLFLSALFIFTVKINGLTRICPSLPAGKFSFEVRHLEKCFFRSTWKTTWHNAKDACVREGGELAMPKTEEMNKAMPKMKRKLDCQWIGLSDHVEEGVLRWIDGSLMTYEDFIEDFFLFEYLLYDKENEDCATVCIIPLDTSETLWRQYPCDNLRSFICEKDTVENVQDTTRKPRKPKPTALRRLSSGFGYRLNARPDMDIRAFLATACARECSQRLSPCVLINFHKPSLTCRGYSSSDAFGQGKQKLEGWEIWKRQEQE